MHTYELMLVVSPTVEVTEKSARDLAQKLLGEQATITDVSLLGKKQLAYPIAKHEEASYVLVTLTGEGLRTSEVQKKTQSAEEVLRFLLTQKNA